MTNDVQLPFSAIPNQPFSLLFSKNHALPPPPPPYPPPPPAHYTLKCSGLPYEKDHTTKTTPWYHPAPPPQQDSQLASHIERHVDVKGRAYYWNHRTKKSSWLDPLKIEVVRAGDRGKMEREWTKDGGSTGLPIRRGGFRNRGRGWGEGVGLGHGGCCGLELIARRSLRVQMAT